MILTFELEKWTVLKNLFSNINEIIDEVIIECTDNGLKFKGIDRSHICFFEGHISNKLFDVYQIDEPLLIFLDLFELIKILKRGKGKDTLCFEADKEIINITFKNNNKRTFQLIQLDLDENVRDLPVLDYSIVYDCDFESIKDSLKDADIYSDRLTFTCKGDLLLLTCDGQNGKYKNECHLNSTSDKIYSSTFTVEWLLKIFNNKLSSNTFKIHMGNDYPMLIEIVMENIKMNYILAPRLGTD